MSALWDYVTGHPWAMERGTFDRMRMILRRHSDGIRLDAGEIHAAIGRPSEAPNPANRDYQIHNGVALVPIQGVLARHAEDVGGVSQPRGTSYEAVTKHLQMATADAGVERILLVIESPGGSVNGLRNAVEAVRTARLAKPVDALIDGMGCSAAYWLAAAAENIYATADSLLGSVGTVWPWYDDSAAFAKEGIRPVILRSGEDKAIGQDGEVLKPEWIAHLQQMVNQLGGAFVASVAEFRDLSAEQVKTISSGSFWLPDQAMTLGLIDGETTLDALLADMGADATADDPVEPVPTDPAPVHIEIDAKSGAALNILASGTSPKATPAGSVPASSSALPTETETMKITALVLASLIASDPEHAALIASMATGDAAKSVEPATEDSIRSAISTAKTAKLNQRIAALEASDVASKTALAAKDTELAELRAKADKLAGLGKNAPTDPGADHAGAAAAGASGTQREWDALSSEQRMGFCNDIEGFKAWKANAHRDHHHAAAEAAEKSAEAAKGKA